MIDDLLNDYILNPENPEKNFNLAIKYKELGQTAAAISFFLRCADRSNNNLDLAYESLIHVGECFDTQGNRFEHVRCMYKHAISIIPSRPEAYYKLANFQNWHQQYQDSYTLCKQALDICDFSLPNFKSKIKYPGKWGLIYERAVAEWNWGKGQQCRKSYRELFKNYWDEVDDWHKQRIQERITSLGSGPAEIAIKPYYNTDLTKFRYKFPGIENVQKNYSQCFQDMFVLSITNGKSNGTYLEVGSGDAFHCNNTFLLEQKFGWKGYGIEWNQNLADTHRVHRSNEVICADALNLNYEKFLNEKYDSNVIDYLQLDVEPAPNTYEILLKIPFDKYKFRVITYEHDHYVDVTRECREKSRKYLKSKGYKLLVSNIAPHDDCPYEDWWVHPELVDPNIIKYFESEEREIKRCDQFMLCATAFKPNFSINTKSKNTLWVVDNFYENPDEVRKFALNQDYHIGGIGRGYIGNRTHEQFLFPGLKERFEQIMGQEITKWEEHGMNGRFQYCWSGQPLVYHCDSQRWGGMIYLTPDAPYQCGTTLYAHKQTRARGYFDDGWDASWRDVPGDPHLDGTSFEPVDVMGNVYNRLVIFDASNIHSASQYFGTIKENARLWQMFFFD